MRAVPDSLDRAVVAGIDSRLGELRRQEGIAIPWAIESGSRAWGFASPDSDYDCRFVYVRPPAAYLALWPIRDVIETPPDEIFDLNGWDLAKAIRLVVGGNAVVGEWLQSPIVYSGDREFHDAFLALAREIGDRHRIGRHYEHVTLRHWGMVVASDDSHRLKKVLYALRAASALRWLRMNPGSAVPPMSLDDLLAGADAPVQLLGEAARLVELKSRARRADSGPVAPVVADYIADELAIAGHGFHDAHPIPLGEARERAQSFFIEWTTRLNRPDAKSDATDD